MRRGIGRLRAGGGSAAFSPGQITFTTGLWLDPSDITTGFQDSAGTTPQTASGQPTGKRNDKSGRANHVLQATTNSRPEYDVLSSISSDFTDGLDDGYATSTFIAGTLGANMDVFLAYRKNSANQSIAISQASGSGNVMFAANNSDASLAVSGVGTVWSVFVNGVQVGGVNTTTRGQLSTAVGNGSYVVAEVRNADLSAWTQFTVGLYASWMLSADIGGIIVCPAQSTANRNSIRTWLGAKVGLVL